MTVQSDVCYKYHTQRKHLSAGTRHAIMAVMDNLHLERSPRDGSYIKYSESKYTRISFCAAVTS